MICTVIQNKDLDGVLEALGNCEMAEIRLDRCRLSEEEIEECFSSDVPLVATCRIADVMLAEPGLTLSQAEKICEKRLVSAIEAGAAFVDVEIEASKEMAKRVRSRAHACGSVFIRSYHDFDSTPAKEDLVEKVDRCRYYGADLVKLVTMAHSQDDADRVLSLYDDYDPVTLIAFCMGEEGRQSRIECLKRGAQYSYAALTEDEAAAPGQWAAGDMANAVYGSRHFIGDAGQTVRMPASKSFAQRAIIAAALAEGESVLDGYTPCSDSEASISVAQALGAEVTREKSTRNTDPQDASQSCETLHIKGTGASPGYVDIKDLNVGESGLLTRLMIPLSAVISSADVTIEGEKTLLGRPMKGADTMLAAFGVRLSSETVPMKVSGCLESGNASVSGKDGSQLISGLLMALPMTDGRSTVVVTRPKSIPYMFITLDVMKHFGVKVANEMGGDRAFFESGGDWSLCTEITFNVKGGQRYKAAEFSLEGDWSAAANFLVAGAVFGKVKVSGLDTKSLQADISIMDILMDAGASLSQEDGDDGPIAVQRAPLTAFSTDASNCPDLFPIVAVLAAFCQGCSRISGVDRLAHKESDRGKAILQMLDRMGVKAWTEENDMLIEGSSLAQRSLSGNLLKGGKYTSCHDHRMVMALKVAELGADSKIEIDDEECVGKSFPDFLDRFASAVGNNNNQL